MRSVKDRLASGALWLGAARMIANALGFVSTMVLARMLTPDDFGLVALATALLAIFAAVTEMSLSSALIRHQDPTDEHFHTVWTLNVVRGLIIGLLFSAVSYPAALAYHEPRIMPVMIALGLSLMVTGLANPHMAMFVRSFNFKQEFAISVVEKVLSFGVSVTVAVLFRSYWALVAGTVAMQVSRVAMTYLIVPYRPRVSWRHVREFMSFSIWVTLGSAVDVLNGRIDQLLMGTFLGRTTLGYYTMGDTISSLPTREATAPFSNMLLPALSHVRHDRERLRQAYTSAQTLISAIAFPVAFGLPLVAEPFVRLVLGEKWMGAVIVVQIISIVLGLQTLSSAVRPLAFALGNTKRSFNRDMTYFLIRLPLIIIGLWLAGLTGLLYARLVVGLIGIYINMRLVRSLVGLSLRSQLMANWRTLASVVIMSLAVLAVRPLLDEVGASRLVIVAVSIAVAAVAYVSAGLGLWSLTGFPKGPESEIVGLARRALGKV